MLQMASALAVTTLAVIQRLSADLELNKKEQLVQQRAHLIYVLPLPNLLVMYARRDDHSLPTMPCIILLSALIVPLT